MVKPLKEQVPTSLGKRIAYLRERKGWTQKELARQAELSVTFLSEIENDKRNVSSDVLLRIANALGASLDFLLRGEEAAAREREPLLVPPDLARAAEEQGWSYAETAGVLQARNIVVARRSRSVQEDHWTKESWISFYERLFR